AIGSLAAPNVSLDAVGLFGYTENAEISGMHITDAAMYSSADGIAAGSLVGRAGVGTVIDAATFTGTVQGGMNSSVGGIVGRGEGIIRNSYATGAVIGGEGANAGGIAGSLYGTMQNCYTRANITGSNTSNVGGLSGANDGTILNCFVNSSFKVSTGSNFGGITGTLSGSIQNVYSVISSISGQYSGPAELGGIAGIAADESTIENAFWYKFDVTEGVGAGPDNSTRMLATEMHHATFVGVLSDYVFACGDETLKTWKTVLGQNSGFPLLNGVGNTATPYNSAPKAEDVTISGIPVIGETLTVTYTYADAQSDAETGTTYQWYRADNTDGTGLAAISGAKSQTYEVTDLDFQHYLCVEVKPSDGDYIGSVVRSPFIGPVSTAGGITDYWTDHAAQPDYDGDTCIITSAQELAWVALQVNNNNNDFAGKTVRLANEINLGGRFWAPIGTAYNDYKGVFDGNGYSISDLTIGTPESGESSLTYVGLFGKVGGTVKNTHLATPIIYAGKSFAYGGCLAGYVRGAIENCSVDNALFQSVGLQCVGVLVGSAYTSSSIFGCYTSGTVTATGGSTSNYVGGLAGCASGSSVTKCGSSAVVEVALGNAGGLIGYLTSGAKITASHASGNISGRTAGGFVGLVESGVLVFDCYATGDVTSDHTAGGFVGSHSWGEIKNSYATGTVTSTRYSGGFAGSILYGGI
ncbi:MAG: GLUG motif-containing protein, partial [Acetanaerobacterium sp.]